MLNSLHPQIALDMHKIETQHRMAKLEHRRALMERNASNQPAPRARVQGVRRAAIAMAGALIAFSAFAAHLI
jgi:hypothetical protein